MQMTKNTITLESLPKQNDEEETYLIQEEEENTSLNIIKEEPSMLLDDIELSLEKILEYTAGNNEVILNKFLENMYLFLCMEEQYNIKESIELEKYSDLDPLDDFSCEKINQYLEK